MGYMLKRYLEETTDGDPGGGGAADEVALVEEKEARVFGWRPAEEFDGPPERWKSAGEFLAEGKRINGFLRKDLDKLRNELTKRDQTLAELQSTIVQFAEFHRETEARAYDRAKKELQDARRDALRNNDGDMVVEIEDRLNALGDAPPKLPINIPTPSTTPEPDPTWITWVNENSWFKDNTKLRAISNGYADIVRAESPNLVGRPFLDEVKRRVQEDFPEHFQSPARRHPTAVGSSDDSRGPSGSRKTYADLPAEAKQACDKFVKQKLIPSREAYVRDYFGDAA